MLASGFYNMDCMEAMKEFPDKFFDLAIVDPPYGDGGGSGLVMSDSENDLTGIATIPRGGWHGKQKYHLGQTPHQRTAKGSESTELVELGRRSSEKNYCVGCSAEAGIL